MGTTTLVVRTTQNYTFGASVFEYYSSCKECGCGTQRNNDNNNWHCSVKIVGMVTRTEQSNYQPSDGRTIT